MSDPKIPVGEAGTYVLGHSDQELERLTTQARVIDPITCRFLLEAGIVPGMRVLDVGTGPGDVAFLAAEIVGATGEVIGVDRAAAAVVFAKERAAARSLGNVSFRVGDPSELTFEQPFDAVVGRYVLVFQHDPAAMLRKLVGHVRPGGVVLFHEPDFDSERSFPPVPSYDRCCRWVAETLRLSGADPQIGIKLHAAFVAAGLPAPSMRLESVIGGSANISDLVHFKADLANSLAPAMEPLGVATMSEVNPQTLAERMLDEIKANDSVIVGRSEIGAWSRV